MDIQSDGLKEIDLYFNEILSKSKNLGGISATLESIFNEDAKLRFASSPPIRSGGIVYGGEYWKPLSKKNRRSGGQILIDSRTLEQSLTEGDGNNYFEVINGTEVLWGSLVPYANNVQRDRPFLFWHPELLEKVAGAIAQYWQE